VTVTVLDFVDEVRFVPVVLCDTLSEEFQFSRFEIAGVGI